MTVCVVCVGDLPIAVDNSVPGSKAPKSESPPPLPPKTDDMSELLIPPDGPLTLDPQGSLTCTYVTFNIPCLYLVNYASVHNLCMFHSSKVIGNQFPL